MSSSVSGSSTVNGLYSNPNKISGLVSGLDTESMIEGLVDSYNMKIIGYQQDIVKMQWQQNAYRDVTTDLMAFVGKYTSFSSASTNLLSSSLFDSVTTTSAQGANADAISVTGTSSSDVQINSVIQMATTSRYESTTLTGGEITNTATAKDGIDMTADVELGTMEGYMSFNYGSTVIEIDFTKNDLVKGDTPEEQAENFAKLINEKLQQSNVTINGTSYNGADVMEAYYNEDTNSVEFRDVLTKGSNSVTINNASNSVKAATGIITSQGTVTGVDFTDSRNFITTQTAAETLSGTSITVNSNGTSKTIDMPKITEGKNEAGVDCFFVDGVECGDVDAMNAEIINYLNVELEAAFGGTVSVDNASNDTGTLQLAFTVENYGNNTISVSSSIGEKLGFGSNGTMTNYTNVGDGIGELLGEDYGLVNSTTDVDYDQYTLEEGEAYMQAKGSVTLSNSGDYYYDADGDKVRKITQDGEDIWVKTDEDGNLRKGETLTINGTDVGVFDANSSLSSIISSINSSDCGVKATFSSTTNKIIFDATESGSFSEISMDSDLAVALFGEPQDADSDAYTQGVDMIMLAEVNGEEITLVRNSNTVEIDGLKITVSDTFNNTYTVDGEEYKIEATYDDDGNMTKSIFESLTENQSKIEFADPITFKEDTDVSDLVDIIAGMVDDYNELMSKVKGYLTDIPLSNSSGGSYLPLTDEDSSTMTEAAILTYEEKAKTGILFGDTNMRALYSSLSSVFSASGAYGSVMTACGFDVTYGTSSSGDAVTLDKDKLKEMLETDLESVKGAFVGTADSHGADGIMTTMQTKMNQYGSVTGSPKGILVEAAGSELSSLSLLSNTMQTKIDNFQTMIEQWEDKLSSQVDKYTAQFTQLEILMANMNSQSSALSGLGGGY